MTGDDTATPPACPACDTPLRPGARFCNTCGAAVSGGPPLRQSSRLVTGLVVATVAMLLAAGAVITFGLRGDDSTDRIATEPPSRQQPEEPAAPPPTDPSSESGRESRSNAPTTAPPEPAATDATTQHDPAPREDPGDDPDDEAPTVPSGPRDECTRSMGNEDAVSSLSDLDFSELTVNVGSKDFVEQFVLGHLLIIGLEAGGAAVVDNVNLGGTIVNRDALEWNEIDAYWEYTGTGWTVHLGREVPSYDSQELAIDVCVDDLEENAIRWIGVSPFNNTYGFATAGDMEPTGLDLAGMAAYVLDNPDATVCMETEYPNRPDGLRRFESAYDWTLPDEQMRILDLNAIYVETATGSCTFGEVFTTDGRIPALGLEVLDDPGVHIIYNVSLTMPDNVYQQAPDQFRALAHTIVSGLDTATMAELNRQVTVDGLDPRIVARNHLERLGLI